MCHLLQPRWLGYICDIRGELLAIHWTVTTHGTWLHGDPRGSWKYGQLTGPDPLLQETALSRLSDDAERLSPTEMEIVAQSFGQTCRQQQHRVLAATVQTIHAHLLLAPVAEPIKTTVARLKRRSAVEVFEYRRRHGLKTSRHLWTTRPFVVFIYEQRHLNNTIEYIRRHNTAIGRAADPYDWIEPIEWGDCEIT